MANLQIFISYAREDVEAARRLYRDLKNAELNPWLDEESSYLVKIGNQLLEKP